MLVSSNGTLLRSEIVGSVKLNTQLTGMPELRLGLNDRVQWDASAPRGKAVEADGKKKSSIDIDDVTFHQCVKQSKFESDRTISFVPPDGEFELMSYRLATSIKPLIWIDAVVERHQHSRVEYMITVRVVLVANHYICNL